MANYQSPQMRKEPLKPTGKLVSFFVQPAPRSNLESSAAAKKPIQSQMSDIIPQGKSLNIAIRKVPLSVPPKADILKPSSTESDERYQYLMKRGIIRRVEKDEKMIFAELPGLAGVLVVYRSPSERSLNPERLNLDRRDLNIMPLLEGEEKLRLLNYQHNQITKIENLLSLPNLIFLDLYNNQIKDINGLHTVPGLRVLMLGRNLIEKIKNLNALIRLDVLDLHSNKISKIENLGSLAELRVVNLANNQIQVMEGLEMLKSLTEINLRRNLIDSIKGLGNLGKLQRLFLSNNKLDKTGGLEALGSCAALSELALDGNPIQGLLNYPALVLSVCKNLASLDMKKVTQEMRETAVRTPKIVQEALCPSENLILTISAEWKKEIDRLRIRGLNSFKRRKEVPGECLIQSGHAEIEGDSLLFIYGNALEVIGKPDFHDSVTCLHFQFIRFDFIIQNVYLQKLKKFLNLSKIVLSENNLHSFIQLSKLENLLNLSKLNIEKNDSVFSVIFRSFVVYRFPNLTEINNQCVTEEDKAKAKQQFESFDRILRNTSVARVVKEEDKENQKDFRAKSKGNSSFAEGYVRKIVESALNSENKALELSGFLNGFYRGVCKNTVQELSDKNCVNDDTLYN